MAQALNKPRAPRAPACPKQRFDARHGADLLRSVPLAPGVYRWLAADGSVLYVGKAKNLRRRLAQYRAARRTKKERKMWRLVGLAARLEWEALPSELDACLEEVRLIQALRPPENVASAFDFLYPLVGLARAGRDLRLCFTTVPERFPEWTLHGAYRSREATAAAFFALTRLLRHVTHPMPRRALGDEAEAEYSYVLGFRQIGGRWPDALDAFLRGADPALPGELALALLERPTARARPAEVEADLHLLRDFFRLEAAPLRDAADATGFDAWPVPQPERDPLFLRYRAAQRPLDSAATKD